MTGDGCQGFSCAGPETGDSSYEEGHAKVPREVFTFLVLWPNFELIGGRVRSAFKLEVCSISNANYV